MAESEENEAELPAGGGGAGDGGATAGLPGGNGGGGGNGGDGAGALAADGADAELAFRRRESALEQLKKKLAESEITIPRVTGYDLRKARKILRNAGVAEDKLRVRWVEDEASDRGTVVDQRPRAGERVDLADDLFGVDVRVADQSAAQYLPHLYQRSDLSGRNFLADFVWVFQHLHNDTDEKLRNIHVFFDPLESPPRFLPWLASWVALTLEDDWPEHKKRNLIRKAVELYQLRGTLRGLRLYLKIFTDTEPTIRENEWPFTGVVEGIHATVGVDTILMHSVDRAHCFTVELPLSIREVDVPTIQRIHRIIEREKPAHTDYYLLFAPEEEQEVDTGIEIGVRSTVGVDTWITAEEEQAAIEEGKRLGGEE